LISSTSGPDPYPERGEHVIRLAVALEDDEPKNIYDAAFAFCHPLSIISGTNHGGKLPPAKELLSLNSASTILSSSGLCPDGGILLRFYEMKGLKDKVAVNLPTEVKNAVFVDLDGKSLKGWNEPVSVKGNSISFEMFPYRICGIKVSYL
jgi:alpha-mannosidase